MSFCCPIHGYYHPTPGTTLAMCPVCTAPRLPAASSAARGSQRCPVCEGHGIVPHGFYAYPPGQTFTTGGTGPEKCRRCDGLGTIPITAAGA